MTVYMVQGRYTGGESFYCMVDNAAWLITLPGEIYSDSVSRYVFIERLHVIIT